MEVSASSMLAALIGISYLVRLELEDVAYIWGTTYLHLYQFGRNLSDAQP